MGCDIHTFVERYNDEAKRWEPLNLYKKKEDGGFEPIPIYDGRNYELFGLLAGIRGSSFLFSAGYGYIVEQRGLPNDLSPYVEKRWENGKDADGVQWWHTSTWYDFCELETYAYLLNELNNVIKNKNRVIAKLENDIRTLKQDEDDEFDCLHEEYNDEFDDDYNGIDALQGFVCDIRRVIEEYGCYNPKPNEIRVIMWFDN